jgi:hypothetical protein
LRAHLQRLPAPSRLIVPDLKFALTVFYGTDTKGHYTK